MKKTLLISMMLFMMIASIHAQVKTSKNGIPVLPQAGDYALGINAVPVLQYLGNMFNNTAGNTIAFNFIDNNNFIFGKYFVTDLMAYRIGLRIGHTSVTNGQHIVDDLDVTKWVLDKHTNVRSNVILGLGIEKRKGVHRIQGIYGVDAMLGINAVSHSYTYGNEITGTNTNPGTTNFGNNLFFGARSIKQKEGFGFGIGARGFVGVEYFILPKLSLGGEFGWGFQVGIRGTGMNTLQAWNFTDLKVEEREVPNGKGSVINIDTDNANGTIKLMFHF
jgi:hypothetical protein